MSRWPTSCTRPPRLARVFLAHLVPHLLGVDEHAVEVEDDRFGHSAT